MLEFGRLIKLEYTDSIFIYKNNVKTIVKNIYVQLIFVCILVCM